jgi:hypothetical protein
VSELFGRAFRLIVGTTEIDARADANLGLRFAFAVNRDDKRTPNNVEVKVWNLSPSVRESLAKAEVVPVSLEAGYVDDVGQIFLGDLRSARSCREGADFVTTICGGDGESKIRTARINRTFPAGTPVATVLKALASALGVGPGNSARAAAALSGKLSKARTISGLCYDELEAFCRTQGLRWSVQDSALQIRVEGQPVLPTTGPLLRNDSGLIGDVEVEKNATVSRFSSSVSAAKLGAKGSKGTIVSGRCLLRPDLIPGVAFRVESPNFSGNLVCLQTNHSGDSWGQEWYCDWVGKPYG